MTKWNRAELLSKFKIKLSFGTNWSGVYYNNTELQGTPIYSERLPKGINVNWGTGSPNAAVPSDNFSARFSSTQEFNKGYYEFLVAAESGVRVLIDGALVFDEFVLHPRLTSGSFFHLMTAGSHNIVVEYFAAEGLAAVQFSWYQFPSDYPPQPSIVKTPHSVFVSYSRDDWDEFVNPLVARLEQHGIQFWIDQHLLQGGDNWLDEINEALTKCELMILCVSPKSIASKWVKMEYRHFIKHDKKVIPLLIKETQLPAELDELHWLKYQALDELIRLLKRELS